MDVYKRLAKKLDELPEGFPATESGVEIKILRTIFAPEEAEMALKLTADPETAQSIAKRLGKPLEEMRSILDGMVVKGQIGSLKMAGQQVYRLVPFLIGIIELQGGKKRLTKELAELFEEYLPILRKKLGGHKPHLTRVIPVNAQIQADLQILQHDDIRQIFQQAKSFRVQECFCRVEKALLGQNCKHPIMTCINYSMEENAYDYFKLEGVITRDEALKIMDEAEKEGLVHCTYNVEKGIGGFLCNCCSCCCGLLRNIKEFKVPYYLAKSRYVAHIEHDTCLACGVCKDERCPIDAITEEDGRYHVLDKRCIGCGVCTITCPSESIKLIERPELDRDEIPQDRIEWSKRRLAERGQVYLREI